MKLRHKIGFGLYLLDTIMAIATGFAYFFSGKVMPYHAQVIGKDWAEVDRGIQIIFLSLMQNYGAAVIAYMFLSLVVLFIPFRQGERWANWTLFLVNIVVFAGLTFFVNFKTYLATNVLNPWPLLLAGIVMGVLAFLLSIGMEKEKK